jgi:hypothetical protein
MAETVKVLIDKKGNAAVVLYGFHGSTGCSALAAKLAQNGRVVDEQNKPEFYETVEAEQTIAQG